MESVGSCQQRRNDYSLLFAYDIDNDFANNEDLKYAVTFLQASASNSNN